MLTLLALATAWSAALPPQTVRPRIPTLVLTGENTGRDWRFTSTLFRQVLADSGKFSVEISLYPDGALLDPGYIGRFELLVVDYDGKRWGERSEKAFLEAVHGGTDVVVLNESGRSFTEWEAFEQLFGSAAGAAEQPLEDFASIDLDLLDAEHPLVAGLEPVRGLWDVPPAPRVRQPDSALVALAAVADEPVLLAGSHGAGRVVHLRLGNVVPGDQRSWQAVQDPSYQQLLLRSAEWAATGAVTPNRRIEPNTLTAADRAAGWRLLFDGTSTSGWKPLGGGAPEERWRTESGVLHVLPGEGGGEIVFEEIFERFELEVEWKVAEGGDPGVLQRLDERDGGTLGLGADGVDPALRVLRPPGEFNHARVVATEDHVEHWLNGIHLLTFDMSSGQWAEMVRGRNLRANLESGTDLARLPLSRIALRGGGIDVWMRNIKIRRLPEPVRPASAPDPTKWLFNGEDLDDWVWIPRKRHSTNPFSVRDGLLVSAGGPDAYLRTARAYRDYVIELEYRFSDGSGESGLLFHLSGGDQLAAEGLTWPRSIEVQLASNRAGDLRIWDRVPLKQARNIEVGVMQRTHDNDLRPGEWNRLEVLHAGGTFRVRLNGETVNAVTEVEQAEGFFAVMAEGAALELRNVRLTPVGGG